MKQPGLLGLSPRDTPQIVRHRGAHLLWSGWQYKGGASKPQMLTDILQCYSPIEWTTLNPAVPLAPYSPLSSEGDWLYAIDTMVRRTRDYLDWEVVGPVPFQLFDSSGDSIDWVRIHKIGKLRLLLLPTGELWSTTDWTNWTRTVTPIEVRQGAVSIVHDGKFMVIGGAVAKENVPPEAGYPHLTSMTTMWEASDPLDPSSYVTSHPAFDPRMWPAVVAHEGELWLTGGYSNQRGHNFNFSDTFVRRNGHWDLVPVAQTFTPVHGHALISDNGSLYSLLGNANPNGTIAEIWRFSP